MPFQPPAAATLTDLTRQITACRRCPRLVAHREGIAQTKRPAYAHWDYWAKPVPGFGDPAAPLLALGLAPAAHGGNRTGRVFTGDASANFLIQAMHQAGLANQPISDHKDDGLQYTGVYIAAAVRCVPPGDKPAPDEQRNCLPYLTQEMRLLPNLRVILALGQIAFQAALRALAALQHPQTPAAQPRPRGKFRHGQIYRFAPETPIIIACYHPSPRNTNTGKLSMQQLIETLQTAKDLSEAELATKKLLGGTSSENW